MSPGAMPWMWSALSPLEASCCQMPRPGLAELVRWKKVLVQQVSGETSSLPDGTWPLAKFLGSTPRHSMSTTGYSCGRPLSPYGLRERPPVTCAPDQVTVIRSWSWRSVCLSTDSRKQLLVLVAPPASKKLRCKGSVPCQESPFAGPPYDSVQPAAVAGVSGTSATVAAPANDRAATKVSSLALRLIGWSFVGASRRRTGPGGARSRAAPGRPSSPRPCCRTTAPPGGRSRSARD